jgi:hypothetical protein
MDFLVLLVEGMNFFREGGAAPFSEKIHTWILHSHI